MVPSSRYRWPRGLRSKYVTSCMLGLRVRVPPAASHSISLCSQVEVSETGRSLVQRSPIDFVMILIRCNNNPPHLHLLGRRCQTKKKETNKECKFSETVFQKYLNCSIIFVKCVIRHFAINTTVCRLKPVVSRGNKRIG